MHKSPSVRLREMNFAKKISFFFGQHFFFTSNRQQNKKKSCEFTVTHQAPSLACDMIFSRHTYICTDGQMEGHTDYWVTYTIFEINDDLIGRGLVGQEEEDGTGRGQSGNSFQKAKIGRKNQNKTESNFMGNALSITFVQNTYQYF